MDIYACNVYEGTENIDINKRLQHPLFNRGFPQKFQDTRVEYSIFTSVPAAKSLDISLSNRSVIALSVEVLSWWYHMK